MKKDKELHKNINVTPMYKPPDFTFLRKRVTREKETTVCDRMYRYALQVSMLQIKEGHFYVKERIIHKTKPQSKIPVFDKILVPY